MPNLREQLQQCLVGRVCVVGVGNQELGDDALGLRLAELLAEAGVRPVLFAGTQPERFLDRIGATGCERVLFLDATDFGAAPGAVALLETEALVSRFPQVSTHKLSLGLLARLLEQDGFRQAYLLGVQPETPLGQSASRSGGNDRWEVRPTEAVQACRLSEPVQRTVEALADLLLEVLVPVQAHATPAAREPAELLAS